MTESLTGANAAFSRASKAEQAVAGNLAEAIATIISALAEAQDDILEAITRNGHIIKFLFTLVSSDLIPDNAKNSSLSCLMTLTEDNRQFVETILGDSQSNIFKHLMSFRAGSGLRAVLACGVLHNVFSTMEWDDANPGREKSSDASLIPALTSALETTPVAGNLTNGASGSSPVEILQLALEILASIGTALQDTFERGNKAGGVKGPPADEDTAMDADGGDDESDNELEVDEDDDDGDDDDEDDDDDEMNEDQMEADMEMVTGADGHDGGVGGLDDLPTLQLFIQKAVPQIVKLSTSASNDEKASLLIRTHAYTALNNIAWTISGLDFSDASNTSVQTAWTPVAKMIWTTSISRVLSSDTSDVSLATVVTSLAWAIARALRNNTPVGAGEPKKFMSLYQASVNLPADAEDPFQSLGVKCVGVLGQLALDPAPIQLNREIGVFLVTVVAKLPETPAADAVEALNQLFDIYADEDYDCDKEVFWKDGFIKYLEDVTPKVKAMAKKVDKRNSTELRMRADEVSLNLTRFILYKQKNKPKA